MTGNVLKLVPQTNMKVIDAVWFTPGVRAGNTVGIVLVEDMTMHYTKAYVGNSNGLNETEDSFLIAQWGAKVPRAMAESLFGPLPDWKD